MHCFAAKRHGGSTDYLYTQIRFISGSSAQKSVYQSLFSAQVLIGAMPLLRGEVKSHSFDLNYTCFIQTPHNSPTLSGQGHVKNTALVFIFAVVHKTQVTASSRAINPNIKSVFIAEFCSQISNQAVTSPVALWVV